MNKVIIIGNVGKDPNITTFANGDKAAQFTIADSQKEYTTKNGVQIPAHTEWFNVCAKGNTADVVEKYVHKGDKIYIEGRQNTRQYTDKENNQKTFTEITIERLELLGSKPQQSTMEQQTTALFGEPKQVAPTEPTQDGETNNDGLPF